MKLGLVTYNMAKDWDIPTIINNCTETGFEGVELRTTHAHKVEVSLSQTERSEVAKMFADSAVKLAGMGSAFDYHSSDINVVRQNVEGTKEYTKLAADVGAPGVKVRPNGFPDGISEDATIEQIGLSLRECGEFASGYGVEIRLEVHGRGTSELRHISKMMEIADHDNVLVCWNSNFGEVENDSIKNPFSLVQHKIGLVHITELHRTEYPWRELFSELKEIGYKGFTLAEISGSDNDADAVRIMNFYRALWNELNRP